MSEITINNEKFICTLSLLFYFLIFLIIEIDKFSIKILMNNPILKLICFAFLRCTFCNWASI